MKSPCSVEILLDITQLDVGGRCNGFEHKAEASFRTPKVLVGRSDKWDFKRAR